MEEMLLEPRALCCQGLTPAAEGTEHRAAGERKIRPPAALGIRLDVAGARDSDNADRREVDLLAVDAPHLPIRPHQERDHGPVSVRTGRRTRRRGWSTRRPSRDACTAASCEAILVRRLPSSRRPCGLAPFKAR